MENEGLGGDFLTYLDELDGVLSNKKDYKEHKKRKFEDSDEDDFQMMGDDSEEQDFDD